MPLVIEGKECACLGDPTTHGSPLAPGVGALTVLYNGRPIWRVGIDFHACPIVKGVVPDVGGVVAVGALRTFVMGSLAARKGDMVVEVPGGPNMIIMGAMGMGGQAGQVQNAEGGVVDDVFGAVERWVGEAIEAIESPFVDPKGPYHTQDQNNSCVVASTRNMLELQGKEAPSEADLRDEFRTEIGDPNHDFDTTGTDPTNAAKVLEKHGVKTETTYGNSVPDVESKVADGPAMVGFKNPGHRVILQSVTTDSDGNKTYNVIDPDPAYKGQPRAMSANDFGNKYNPDAAVIKPTK